MATNDTPQSTSRSYRYLHLMPEELAPLSHDELLQACLEYRSLLQIIAGILTTPQTSLTLRIVAADLLYIQAQRISTGQLLDEAAPVVYDIKAVSERLGMRPVEVRRAYEQLAELGGVHILARQFPKRREQP
jgi:hypothetical protein